MLLFHITLNFEFIKETEVVTKKTQISATFLSHR